MAFLRISSNIPTHFLRLRTDTEVFLQNNVWHKKLRLMKAEKSHTRKQGREIRMTAVTTQSVRLHHVWLRTCTVLSASFFCAWCAKPRPSKGKPQTVPVRGPWQTVVPHVGQHSRKVRGLFRSPWPVTRHEYEERLKICWVRKMNGSFQLRHRMRSVGTTEELRVQFLRLGGGAQIHKQPSDINASNFFLRERTCSSNEIYMDDSYIYIFFLQL
jgi:hypothetical protein